MEEEFVWGHVVFHQPVRRVDGDAQEPDVSGIKIILGT